MLEELASKAVKILTKAEVIDEKLSDVKETVKDHEKRIAKLEGSIEGELARLESAFDKTKLQLLEMMRPDSK